MTVQTFILNGQVTTIDVSPDVRVLWVLRDLLGVTGPKYGCGINVCKACTSHINGRAFNPCSVKMGDLKSGDRVDTIEGLPRTVGAELHPMQQAWIDRDVAQCGYCQPGQIMAAVALVKRTKREGRGITEADLDNIRNICRCGTYTRIREAIEQGAAKMQLDDTVPAPLPEGTFPVETGLPVTTSPVPVGAASPSAAAATVPATTTATTATVPPATTATVPTTRKKKKRKKAKRVLGHKKDGGKKGSKKTTKRPSR